jgi:hypothetical protein
MSGLSQDLNTRKINWGSFFIVILFYFSQVIRYRRQQRETDRQQDSENQR